MVNIIPTLAHETDSAVHDDQDRTAPRGQRRVANKMRRVRLIKKAAEHLIVEAGSTDFTMQQLAEKAGVSLATAYNLIGTKAVVLYDLLDASL